MTPRQIVQTIEHQNATESRLTESFIRQLIWREFATYLLIHFPHSIKQALKPAYDSFPWQSDEKTLTKWQKGLTGYPIIDAGMRQLWSTGWMHNRVRMITASFLVKQLLQSWQDGARWFWDTLVDADLANNTMGWQWSAGCGADAAPYFRVFNPVTQGEKFDPSGDYVRSWIPELKLLPMIYLHRPWEASHTILADAGIKLGRHYPNPVMGLQAGRIRALDAYRRWKSTR